MENNRTLFSKIIIFINVALYAVVLIYIVVSGFKIELFIAMMLVVILIIGIKFHLLGLLFSLATMNLFFNLIPSGLLNGQFISKIWDLGFFLMTIFGFFLFLSSGKTIRAIKTPFYFKVFLAYLGVCIISFFITLANHQYPVIDIIRVFRSHLGYIFIPILLLYLMQAPEYDRTQNLHLLLKALYYISYFLLVLYVLQFLIKQPIFHGYSRTFSIGGDTYIRSVPQFLFICFFFLWFNLISWLTCSKMYPGSKIYIFLSIVATLLTFTRGYYISVSLTLATLLFLSLKSKKIHLDKLFIVGIAAFAIISIAALGGVLDPFSNRAATISTLSLSHSEQNTFIYRINLLRDRIKIIENENALLIGIGFVHDKYGFHYGSFLGNYSEEIDGPALSCADIGWGNIIYRTGYLGVMAFLFFIVSLIFYMFNNFNYDDMVDSTSILELATLLELLNNIIQMWIGNTFTDTGSIQNMAVLFAMSVFLYSLRTEKS